MISCVANTMRKSKPSFRLFHTRDEKSNDDNLMFIDYYYKKYFDNVYDAKNAQIFKKRILALLKFLRYTLTFLIIFLSILLVLVVVSICLIVLNTTNTIMIDPKIPVFILFGTFFAFLGYQFFNVLIRKKIYQDEIFYFVFNTKANKYYNWVSNYNIITKRLKQLYLKV